MENKINSRQRMRISNRHAVQHLLKTGYTQVWLKAHTKFHDTVYCMNEKYKALDLFNLWDGIALTNDDHWFVQIKTNAWPNEENMTDWLSKHNAKGMAVNVKNMNKGIKDDNGNLINEDWQVFVRYYE